MKTQRDLGLERFFSRTTMQKYRNCNQSMPEKYNWTSECSKPQDDANIAHNKKKFYDALKNASLSKDDGKGKDWKDKGGKDTSTPPKKSTTAGFNLHTSGAPKLRGNARDKMTARLFKNAKFVYYKGCNRQVDDHTTKLCNNVLEAGATWNLAASHPTHPLAYKFTVPAGYSNRNNTNCDASSNDHCFAWSLNAQSFMHK